MYRIRDIMYCRPGKVGAMKDKMLVMAKLSGKMGMGQMRIMTDFCAERYWTVVAEFDVESLEKFEKMMSGPPSGASEAEMKEFEQAMSGYHDLVQKGKREIYKLAN